MGQRDRIVYRVRVVTGRHRHRLRRAPVCRRESQARRGRGHDRSRVPGDPYRDIRRRRGIENHRVSVPGRVFLRHHQRCLRDRDPVRVVVRHRHHDAADRDPAVVRVRARRAVGKRDHIVRGVRVVGGRHRHRLRRAPVCRRESQARRGRSHLRARVPGDRHRDLRRRLGIENHGVSVPGRVFLRHRQRCLRDRDPGRGGTVDVGGDGRKRTR